MNDWSNKISSATVGPRDYGQGVVISYWNGIVTSGSVEEATEKHGWPLKIEPFDKNRLFREITKLESKVEEMQNTMQDIHDKLNNGASHEFEETIQYCVTKAFYALKGESQ